MTETYFRSLRLCSSAALRYPLAFFFNKASRFIPLRELNRWPFPANMMCCSILTHRTPSCTSMEENKEHIKVKDLRIHSDLPNCHDLFLVHSCFFLSVAVIFFACPVLTFISLLPQGWETFKKLQKTAVTIPGLSHDMGIPMNLFTCLGMYQPGICDVYTTSPFFGATLLNFLSVLI